MRERVPALDIAPDDWVRQMMRWHFSDLTGSPFWLARRPTLGFDPLIDIRTLDDIRMFGPFDKSALRNGNAGDLVPRGFAGRPRRIFETGGTTGAPCRIPDIVKGRYDVALYHAYLEARGLAGGDIVAMTPAGPHAYGTFVGRLADCWNGNVTAIDFDPRWVKALGRGRKSTAPYLSQLIEQTRVLLESQSPAFLFSTSKLVQELALSLPHRLSEYGVRVVCTGGTSCSAEEEYLLRDGFLAGVDWLDTYGNTLMGHALQGDPWNDCAERAYYLPRPQAYAYVVDPTDWRIECAPGSRGRVMLVTLHEDLFIPNLLERDSAVAAPPHPWFPFPGLMRIEPVAESEEFMEGVY